MPPPPARPDRLRGKIFRGSTAVRSGLLTKAQLRSSAWQRLFPDVYACASLPLDHRLRAVAVAGVLLRGAVLTGRSAAVVWGVELAAPDDDVQCAIEPSCRAGAVRGVEVTRRLLAPDEVTSRRRVTVTTPVRTALDLARRRPLDDAVVDLDRFLRSGLLDLTDVRDAAGVLPGPGCRLVRRAVELADGLAGSPQETRLRLLMHRSPLPRPVAQHVVRDAGGFVARVDFAWPEARVAVEYEGRWHGQNVASDRRRLNGLTAAGWTVLFVTAEDLADPVAVVARIAAALAASRYVSGR
ncbi:DUF559 domain-containing protein [Blastococcus sp. SYSU D00669]